MDAVGIGAVDGGEVARVKKRWLVVAAVLMWVDGVRLRMRRLKVVGEEVKLGGRGGERRQRKVLWGGRAGGEGSAVASRGSEVDER